MRVVTVPCTLYAFDAFSLMGKKLPRKARNSLSSASLQSSSTVVTSSLTHHPPSLVTSSLSSTGNSELMLRQAMEKSAHKLPKDTEKVVIEGGNHRGFASYDWQPFDWEVSEGGSMVAKAYCTQMEHADFIYFANVSDIFLPRGVLSSSLPTIHYSIVHYSIS